MKVFKNVLLGLVASLALSHALVAGEKLDDRLIDATKVSAQALGRFESILLSAGKTAILFQKEKVGEKDAFRVLTNLRAHEQLTLFILGQVSESLAAEGANSDKMKEELALLSVLTASKNLLIDESLFEEANKFFDKSLAGKLELDQFGADEPSAYQIRRKP